MKFCLGKCFVGQVELGHVWPGRIRALKWTDPFYMFYLFIYLFVSAIHVLTMTIHSKNVKMFKIHGCLANAREYRLHPVAADSTPSTWLQLLLLHHT